MIDYKILPENIGGSGGFYEGIRIAYDMGYEFIWLMDDDGRPKNNLTFEEIYNVSIKLFSIK